MRNEEMTRGGLIVASLIIAACGILQQTTLTHIGGVKINLTLVALVAFSFFLYRIGNFAFLIFIAALFLRFRPSFEFESLALIIVALVAYVIKERLPGKPFVNCLLLQAIATVGFYLIIDPHFIYANPLAVTFELVYNVAVGAILFLSIDHFIPYGKRKQFTI